ncbi:chaperonin 10-like protein [Aspergillus bertholletiae]|uniref:Chaperonin 10-like protein n=1 Tax=Aspergillus bertholletiae TaxID=1226010 RepID=A0A5N7BBC1_9EURO|nr:chaperonin 10-like protein [Aspergillus bertholletiae]
MSTMQAIVSNSSILARVFNQATGKIIGGKGGQVQQVPIPTISADEILVQVKAVALNPTDFKHLDVVSPPNSTMGCDFAGVVHQVGEAAKARWKIGDRVAGVADSDLVWRVPDSMTDTDATTYGISAVTAMLSLNSIRSPLNEAIFIYAGSTSAGLYHIQIAKAAGYAVITTASPRSFNLVKRYGADGVYDYRSSTVAADVIKDYLTISKAVDCFSEGNSTSICAEVIKSNGGRVMTLLPNGGSAISNVTYGLVMAYTVFGHSFAWLPPAGPRFEARPGDREALVRFYETLPRVTHILRPIPAIELRSGFEGIFDGLDALRAGLISGGKQVVRLSDKDTVSVI